MISLKKAILILFVLAGMSPSYGKTFPVCKEYYYINENQTKEKSTFLERILKENPENVECMLKLSSVYLRTNRVSAAFDLIRRAYTLNPEYVEKQNISRILDLALRLSRLQELAHKNRDYDLYNELGDTYYEIGVFDEASKAYEKSLEINPNQPKIRILVAVAYSNLGFYDKAERELRYVVEEDPYNFYGNYYLGKVLKNGLKREKEGLIYLRMASYLIHHTDLTYEKEGEEEFLKRDLADELRGKE